MPSSPGEKVIHTSPYWPCLYCFSVGYARLLESDGGAVTALQSADDYVEVSVALAGENELLGLFIVLEFESVILFDEMVLEERCESDERACRIAARVCGKLCILELIPVELGKSVNCICQKLRMRVL